MHIRFTVNPGFVHIFSPSEFRIGLSFALFACMLAAMHRRFLALLALPLVLSACGGGNAVAECQDQYWDGAVGTCLPAGWTVVDRETLSQRGVGEEVVAAFQAEESVSGQFPTVLVTREVVADDVTPDAYSKASIRSVSTLPGYKLVDSRAVTIDDADIEMHIFTAQPLSEEPERKFYQISTVHSSAGFTFTALTPVSTSSALEKEILLILQSATLTQPEAGGASS